MKIKIISWLVVLTFKVCDIEIIYFRYNNNKHWNHTRIWKRVAARIIKITLKAGYYKIVNFIKTFLFKATSAYSGSFWTKKC